MNRPALLSAVCAVVGVVVGPAPSRADQPAADKPVVADEPTATDKPAAGWAPLAGISYSPEAGLAASVALLRYFREPYARRSQVRMTLEVSTEGDVSATLSPAVWLARDKYYVQGVLHASRNERTFWGVGADTPESAAESYGALRGVARVNVGRRVVRGWYVGGVVELRTVDLVETEAGGALEAGDVVGADGSRLLGGGGFVRYDTRNHSFYPSAGALVYASPRLYHRYLGSGLDMGRWFADARVYRQLAPGHILAGQAKVDMRFGDVPFTFMSETGGAELLRGILAGRHRDKHFAGGQVEYRTHLVWRIGATAFAGVGRVADSLGAFDFDHWRLAAGAGLRAAVVRRESLNIRLDFGVSAEGTAIYLDILEAF